MSRPTRKPRLTNTSERRWPTLHKQWNGAAVAGTARCSGSRSASRATHSAAAILFSATLRDITRRKEAEDRLMKLAEFDPLTGLANRRAFVAALERAIADSHRRGSRVAVLYLDLDHSKDVNDTLDHPAGDRLLEAVAQRLRKNLRASDMVARFGGDEFAVLMSSLSDPSDAGLLAKKPIDAAASPFPVDANTEFTPGTRISASGIRSYGRNRDCNSFPRRRGALSGKGGRAPHLSLLRRRDGFGGSRPCQSAR